MFYLPRGTNKVAEPKFSPKIIEPTISSAPGITTKPVQEEEEKEVFKCQSQPDGLYKHPSDCHTFVTCSNGVTYETICPANLFFDDVLIVCNHYYALSDVRKTECESQ